MFRAVAGFREFYERNPYLAVLLARHPTYFLEWNEEELGLFMWRLWVYWVYVDDNMRKQVEQAIEELSRARFPWRMRRCRKLVYAARMAKKLIEREKRLLNID